MTKPQHHARALPEPQRIEYLIAIAAMLHADGMVATSELGKLRELCGALEVSPEGIEKVLAAARKPDPAQVARIVASYRNKDLRFTLLTDAIVMAYADGTVQPGESEEIASWAAALQISTAQAVLIGRYVAEVAREGAAREGQDYEKMSKELADGLADVADQVPGKGAIRWLFVKLGGK